MARVGILGGTFDPPHAAHIAMAEKAKSEIPLDKVLFMPAPSPPHKKGTEFTPYELRVKMVELAIAGREGFELSRMEEFRVGPSYTVDLLEHYKSTSDDELFFIMGSDSVQDLKNWKSPQRILELATLVIFIRPGFSPAIPVAGEPTMIVFEEPQIDISSSDIRKMAVDGIPLDRYLPKAVMNFILDNSLYSC